MDTLSVELHAQIFEYACVDDGSTARALSLVSHYFHEVVKPYLYQSLVVCGPAQLAALEARLAPLPPHLRRIRHLFLSDIPLSARPKPTPPDPALAASYDSARELLQRVLLRAAPTLETLAVHAGVPHTSTQLLAGVLATPLPRVRALAVRGMYPFPGAHAHLPALRRLRLAGNRSPHGLLALGALAAAAPALTHLRVAGLRAAVPFAAELAAAVAPDAPPAACAPLFAAELPPRLRCIVAQLAPRPPQGGKCGSSRIAYGRMMERLRQAARHDGQTRVFVEVGEADGDGPQEMLEQWKRELEGHEDWPL